MNRYHFISLDKNNQLRMLRVHGKMLHRRLKGKYKITLYGMKNFYIEVWYDDMKNQFEDFVTFKDDSLLKYQFNLVRKAS